MLMNWRYAEKTNTKMLQHTDHSMTLLKSIFLEEQLVKEK